MLDGEGHFALTHAASVEAACSALARSPADAILLDLALSGGLDALATLRQAAPYVPIVVLVSPDDSAEDALTRGAQDVLVRGSFDGRLLERSLRYALAISRADQFARAMLDGHSARIAIVDEQGTIVTVNEAWRALAAESGAPPEAVNEGANYLAVCDTTSGEDVDFARHVAAAIRSVLAGERDSFVTGYTCACPDEENWFSLQVTPFPSGGPRRVVIAHEDITERVRAEQRLQHYADQLDALRQVTLDITAWLDLELLLDALVRHAIRLLNAEAGGIYLYRPARDVIEWTVSAGPGMAPLGSELERGEGLSGRVWDSGDPLIVNNYAQWEGRAEVYAGHPWTAVVGVPIAWSGEFLGVLDANARAPRVFTESDVLLLSLLADQAAVAIQNARLYELEREQRALAEALVVSTAALNGTLDLDQVLDTILSSLERIVPHQAANIMLVEDGVGRVVRTQNYPGDVEALMDLRLPLAETPNLKVMADTGRPLAIPDVKSFDGWVKSPVTDWIRSSASAPIVSYGETIGFVNLASATPGFFSEEQAKRLQVFADQAAVAIRNAQLYELEREQRTLAEALAGSAAALNGTLDLNQVLDAILSSLERIVPHQTANIMLVEDGVGRVVRSQNYPGDEEALKDLRLPLAQTPNLKVMADTGRPLAIPDVKLFDGWVKSPVTDWIGSFAGAPIMSHGKTIGFVNVNSATPGFFGDEQAKRLQAFADQAAVAIHNARLYESEREQRALAEALADSAAALNGTLDLDQVLDTILGSLERIVPHQTANIMLVEDGVGRIIRSQNYPGDLKALKSLRLPLAGTPNLKRMAETGRALAIPDTAAYGDWRTFPITAWIRSEAGAPIMSDGKAIGFIFLDSAIPGSFNDEHAKRLQAFADQAAVAIRNARLYQELENYSSILVQAVEERTTDLEEVLKQVQAILHNSPDAILLLNADGTIELVNRAFSETFGYDTGEVAGKHTDLLAAEKWSAMLREAITEVRSIHTSVRLEITARRKNGDLFDADVALASIWQEGVVAGVVCSLRDITALKEVERIKDAFVSTAAHELRTPLTTIRGFAELLLMREMDGERAQRYLGMINEQAINLSKIIDDLLDLSRLEAGHGMALDLQPVDLPPLIEDAVGPFREPNPRHRFEISVASDLPAVRVDPFRVGQVLRNLLSNAVKYSPQGGPISVRAWLESDAVCVSVQDSGIGVPPELQPRLFERFYRVDMSNSAVGGTGLGLTICKQLVEMHGGRIWMENTPGQGSTFCFTLPVEPG